MLRFTKRADYGLMAIHYIAAQLDDTAVSAKRIAEEFNIPSELLAKILQRLAKGKLIVGHNGPKGGYVLARPRTEITVGQVVRALEGPLSVVSCMTDHDDCPQFARCNLRGPVQKIQASITHVLDSMTLAELAAAPTVVPVPPLAAIR
jgi:Rrf2 family protein